MKTYEEMSESVFQRMGEYAEKQKRRRTRVKRAALPVCCCAVLVCCFGAGKLLHRSSDDILTDVAYPTGVTDTVAVGQTDPTPPVPRPDPRPDLIPDRGEPPTADASSGVVQGSSDLPPDMMTEWETEADYVPVPIPTPAPTISPDEAGVIDGPMMGTDTPTEPYEPPVPMISDYACGEVTEVSVTPGNGEVILSPSLRGALEEYGSEARYRLVTLEYRDGVALEPENVEAQEALAALAGDGIVPVVETMYQDGEVTDTLLSLHVSAEALEAFPADADYGYYLKLYGEVMPDADEDTVVEAHSFGMMK